MRRKRLATLASAIALLGFGAVTAAPAHATFPGANGKIAFSRNGEIFVMNPDGTEVTRLTSFGDLSCPNAFSPAWSPNGEKIAYVHFGCSGFSLHVMNADGSRAVASLHQVEHIYLFSLNQLDNDLWARGGVFGIMGEGGLIGSPLPRPYLHFAYNFLVVVPMLFGLSRETMRIRDWYRPRAGIDGSWSDVD